MSVPEHEENPNGLELRRYPNSTALSYVQRRLRLCVETWPECSDGDYDPACCRFPKSCSCTAYWPKHLSDELLEPPDYSVGVIATRSPRPDRAAAAREVETLLRRVEQVGLVADTDDWGMAYDGRVRPVGEVAADIVDRVLGNEVAGGE